jgi:hypothetical protein
MQTPSDFVIEIISEFNPHGLITESKIDDASTCGEDQKKPGKLSDTLAPFVSNACSIR